MNISTRTIIAVLGTTIIVGLMLIYFFVGRPVVKQSVRGTRETTISFDLASEVEAVLAEKMKMMRELAMRPVITHAVSESNKKDWAYTQKEIEELDAAWRMADENSEMVRALLTGDAAEELAIFQESHPGFSEIFITNQKGFNAAQTNRTTDIYQADEDWWISAYDNGRGVESHGSIEFDESAQAEAISLYIPIRELQTGEVIGIAKAVVSIASIKFEL